KLAIIALHLGCHTERRLIDPSTDGRECLALDANEIFRLRKTNRPPDKILSVAPSLFGAFQFLLIRRHGLQCWPLGGIAMNRAEVGIRTSSHWRITRFYIRAATDLLQRARLDMLEQFASIFILNRAAECCLLLHKFVPDLVVI